MEGLTFSPLTSSEFREIESKDQQPPGYSALLMRSYDEELSNILDIAGLPTGSGAGYGVGVTDDELPALDLRSGSLVEFTHCVYTDIDVIVSRLNHDIVYIMHSLSWFKNNFLSYDCSNLGTNTPMGPASASLLQDWLDINQLDPDDIDVLQKELGAGAPDSLMNSLDNL